MRPGNTRNTQDKETWVDMGRHGVPRAEKQRHGSMKTGEHGHQQLQDKFIWDMFCYFFPWVTLSSCCILELCVALLWHQEDQGDSEPKEYWDWETLKNQSIKKKSSLYFPAPAPYLLLPLPLFLLSPISLSSIGSNLRETPTVPKWWLEVADTLGCSIKQTKTKSITWLVDYMILYTLSYVFFLSS